MSRYLLDTHILLWWLENPVQLTEAARKIIADSGNDILVSAATIWKLSIKTSLNKLRMPSDLLERLEIQRFQILDIAACHAMEIRHLPSLHQDPFDRMLIAQTRVERLTLITRDKNILNYGIQTLIG